LNVFDITRFGYRLFRLFFIWGHDGVLEIFQNFSAPFCSFLVITLLVNAKMVLLKKWFYYIKKRTILHGVRLVFYY